MNAQPLPPGFERRDPASHRFVVARTGAGEGWLNLMRHPFGELAARPDARPAGGGRAAPLHLPLPDSDRRVFVRPYAHGGWLGPAQGRLFADPARALAELGLSARAESLSLPVVPLEGVTATRRAERRWELEAWSWWNPNAANLSVCLPVVAAAGDARRALLTAAAGALRRCHDAGLRHADLNARNVIAERRPDAWHVRLVDLDRSVLGPPLTGPERLAQLRRLYRSMVKEGLLGPVVPGEEFATLVRACAGPLDDGALAAFLTGCRRETARHAWVWRMTRLFRRR